MSHLAKKRGVTLLEALIAMAIIGTAFGAILELQANLVRGLDRVNAAHTRAAWSLNAVELAAMIEREADRSGTFDFEDGSRISWSPAPGATEWDSPSRRGLRMRGAWDAKLGWVDFVVRDKGNEVVRLRRLAVSAEPAPEIVP